MIHKDILVATVYNSHFYGHTLFYCDIEQAYYVTQLIIYHSFVPDILLYLLLDKAYHI